MSAKNKVLPRAQVSPTLWMLVSQMFVGLFFVTAAYYKLFDAFFFAKSAPLLRDFEWWLSMGWPAVGMRQFMLLAVKYQWMVTVGGLVVISTQVVGGVLLFANIWKRFAGSILLFVQTLILLGVFHGGIGFQTFIGVSLWLATFYMLSGRITQRKWTLLTYWLVFYGLYLLLHRYRLNDPWPSAFAWQFHHYAADVVSINDGLKQLILFLGKQSYAPYMWASSWWIQLVVILCMLTKLRPYAGIAWLIILIMHEWIWLNGLTSEGTLWILTVFVWLTFEDASRATWGNIRMIPRWSDLRAFMRSCREWLNAK